MSFPVKGVLYESTNLAHNQATTNEGRRETCADIEINVSDCLEAYGLIKGRTECVKFIEDFQECKYAALRNMRYHAMRKERLKQIATGKRSWKDRWGKPIDFDSFTWGVFAP